MNKLKIDFVSDISCPWCIIGLRGLEEALERSRDVIEADISFQPFELNPDMPAGGQNLVDIMIKKFGSTVEKSAEARDMIKARAASVGFTMAMNDESRVYNSFDAHRLLHWAGLRGRQHALKQQLFRAYFTDGLDISNHATLGEISGKAGLDSVEAGEVLASGRYADEVRAAEQLWQSRGISSVPAIVVNDRYLISGGQPPEAFEQALRKIAAEEG